MKVDYLRISLTDRCNFKCFYCMPYGPIFLKPRSTLLSFEEIKEIVEAFSLIGVKKIRFTGGEPFLRKDFVSLLRMISEIKGIEKIGITTNGFFLGEYLDELSEIKHLSSINVSLDTLKKDKFKRITGVDACERVKENIELTLRSGLKVKVNTVVVRGVNEDEIEDIVVWGAKKNLEVRFIELMSFRPRGKKGIYHNNIRIKGEEIKRRLSEKFSLYPVDNEGKTAEFFVEELGVKVGIIFADSDRGCVGCSKLRITPEGKLLFCLKSPLSFDLRHFLLSGDRKALLQKLKSIVDLKWKVRREDALPFYEMRGVGG